MSLLPNSPPDPAPRQRLRLGTRGTHDALEDLPLMRRLMSRDVALADYRRLVTGFYRAYVPLCERLAETLGGLAHPQFGPRDLIPCLRADIDALGLAPPELWGPERMPILASAEQALGCWYVLEGSAQGGAMVAAHLRRRLGPELPVTYLAQRNACTPRRWRRFDAYFADLLQDGVALDEVTAGANAAYSLTTQTLT